MNVKILPRKPSSILANIEEQQFLSPLPLFDAIKNWDVKPFSPSWQENPGPQLIRVVLSLEIFGWEE